MTQSNFIRFLSIVFGAFVVASCSDSGVFAPEVLPDAPSLADAPRNVTGLELRGLWWKDRQRTLVPVSQTIGVLGGTITIPQTGLTISFPAGAVAAPITITITPDADYVAYKMEPAGTQFLAPVTVTQSITYTELDGRQLTKPLYAAYIPDDKVSLSGNVPVSELEPAQTIFSPLSPLIAQSHVWIIRHFSRYMLASG